MVCQPKSRQKFVEVTTKFHGHSRYRHKFTNPGIPLLELLERLSGELGVGFHLVVLNQIRQHSQPRRLEEPEPEQ